MRIDGGESTLAQDARRVVSFMDKDAVRRDAGRGRAAGWARAQATPAGASGGDGGREGTYDPTNARALGR